MRSYGDVPRRLNVAQTLEKLERVDDPTTFVVEAGALAQGLIDAEFHARGDVDSMTPLHRWALDFVRGVKRDPPPLPESVDVKRPEGYAYYAVYPELYARAARALPRGVRRRVIGIRSIGTSLGAVVATAIGADDFVTVRPVGHPFHRTLSLDFDLAGDFDEYLIVDEGPGLSGSSFRAVANALGDRAIVFFPSHPGGPGNQADSSDWWWSARRAYVDFDELFASRDRVDLSAGKWRAYVAGGDRVPAATTREMRKYLTPDGRLRKFAGLGLEAEAKLAKARILAARGLTPRVFGLDNGFMIHEWIDGARLVDLRRDREPLLDTLTRYLVTLGTELAGDGRVLVDNRMHAWEWIVTPRGDVLKCDAVDHCFGHDGIGPQELAWDVAGAIVELDLTEDESHALRAALPRRWTDAEIDRYKIDYATARRDWFTQLANEGMTDLRPLCARYDAVIGERVSDPHAIDDFRM